MYVSSIGLVNLYRRPILHPAAPSFAMEMGSQQETREESRSSTQPQRAEMQQVEEDAERWDGMA